MKQEVRCKYCATERMIIRKSTTAPHYSFYCENCRAEVPQDLFYRKLKDSKK